MTAIKPMLAHSKTPDLTKLTYPLIVQPKFDGIRAMVVDGVLVSRSAKPIRNAEIQAALGRPEFNGLDGELLVGPPTAQDAMQRTSEFVMSSSKRGAAWAFYVFDSFAPIVAGGAYADRIDYAHRQIDALSWGDDLDKIAYQSMLGRFKRVESILVHAPAAAAEAEARLVAEGYEGAILRDPRAPYKHGRSGSKGPLLKVKRFTDSEAEVIGVNEMMHNDNEAKRDAFGRTERSSAAAGKRPAGTLGNLRCRTPEGVEFEIGTGFTAAQRAAIWDLHTASVHSDVAYNDVGRDGIIGRLAKYKYFEVGVKTAPRFPVFLGFRDRDDV